MVQTTLPLLLTAVLVATLATVTIVVLPWWVGGLVEVVLLVLAPCLQAKVERWWWRHQRRWWVRTLSGISSRMGDWWARCLKKGTDDPELPKLVAQQIIECLSDQAFEEMRARAVHINHTVGWTVWSMDVRGLLCCSRNVKLKPQAFDAAWSFVARWDADPSDPW